MMTVAVLCGGQGTRLAPLTDRTPKYLVDVAGQPFAMRQFALLRAHGYTDVVLLIGHLGDQIKAAIGDGARWGMSVRYSEDGPTPLGTDEAIRKALSLLGPAFFVLYGDSYLECDYADVERAFRASGADALLTMHEGVDYGLRAFRRYPPRTTATYTMSQRFKEIGSHEGLAELRRAISR